MADNSNDIQSNHGRGGARQGAGRPKRTSEEFRRWAVARGLNPLVAGEILARCCNEAKTWHRLLNADDDRVVLAAMTFLMSMRDGRPSQQVNLTSLNITLSAEDIASARAIVRELVTPREPSPSVPQRMISESASDSIMVLGDEGGKAVGSG